MGEDIRLPFDLPAVARKKVGAAFDGGRISSDGAGRDRAIEQLQVAPTAMH